jgi:dipeptidyl aminopeptidase/acylaminoacyl peptidase
MPVLLLICGALAGTVPAQFSGHVQAAEISRADQEQTAAAATNRLDATSQQRRGRFGGPERGVYKSQITPHWFPNNTRFWYRNDLRAGAKEFIVVDAEHGTRQPAFDHQKLAASLSKVAAEQFKADHLPFSDIEFVEEGKAVRFEAGNKTWKCDLNSYECAEIPGSSEKKTSSSLNRGSTPVFSLSSSGGEGWGEEVVLSQSLNSMPSAPGTQVSFDSISSSPEAEEPSPPADEAALATQPQTNQAQGQDQRRQRRSSGERERSRRSPDGKWSAFIKDQNVFLRSEDEGKEYPLTEDGKEGNAYGRLEWAPDSKALIGWRIEPGDHKEVYLIESSPPGGGRAVFKARPYDLPGDKLTLYELSVFDVASRKQVKPEVDRFEHGWEAPSLHWSRDQRRFNYVKVDRGHQRYRVIEVDSQTGALRNLIDEKTDTFIWTAHTESLGLSYVNWLEKTDEMIYASERDGWRQLYLVDTKEAKIKNRITNGEFVVRGIDRIDEENRQIWFRAGGRNPGQDPYFVHFYRINFDGTGLAALTEANGNHSIQYSPDRKYVIDTYSRVDLAPVHELRRISDCRLVSKFEEADPSELMDTGWKPPEVFVAKGRDGTTDIWGIICRPLDFDPNKKYPVLEQIYSGPQGSYVPKSFGGARRFSSLTDLGFIVVQMDGMGTANRSKAFHDVCWKNLKDAGFPDRILWHKAAAAKYPWYDITRVGIYGNSAGGQNAAAAVLFHPKFYKAAVANSGCHDNRMDKASWNEQWMGYPVGPQYADCSNIENAGRLQGHLMLIVGEMDDNVPPESTFRFVDALIRANKDFDLLFVPNGGHGAGGSYGQRRLQDFFLRHLQGSEPPNHNASAS